MIPALIAMSILNSSSTDVPQQTDRMQWWREARFGMFIHWGLYSILAGEWKGSKGHAEWIRETAHIPVGDYEGLLAQFNPVKFDADEWVKMAKNAGMKYIVITSKHHDGFNLWDSPFTNWDVMNTPFKRDILKELSDACKRHGVIFCTYHSIMDWHHADYLPKRSWEGETWRESKVDGAIAADHKPNFDNFVKYLSDEVRTIIQKYQPRVMWFDGEWESTWNHSYGKPLYDLCLKTDPRIIVNNRVDVFRAGMEGMTTDEKAAGDFGTPEQTIPATGLPGVDWETCMTMNGNWGYNREDKNFKTTKQMVQMLCDIASKGGNYLMNIGPRADGTFPEESVQRLREIGIWMQENGESIYGTNASPFKSLPWGRCTQKSNGANTTLYLQVFDWPRNGALMVPGIGNEVIRANVIGAAGNARVSRTGSDLQIAVGPNPANEVCTVVRLEIKGKPMIYNSPEIITDWPQFVKSTTVEIKTSPGLDIMVTTDGTDPANSPTAEKYTKPLVVSTTSTVIARTFHNGKAVSGATEMLLEKVRPIAGAKLGPVSAGLSVKYFEGSWDKCPNFATMTPAKSGILDTVNISDDPKKEYCGRLFEGMIEVPEDGMYKFFLRSDDGSMLWVGGKVVVNNDGLHSPEQKSGAIALGKGWHKISVAWFNKSGGADLDLKWSSLGKPVADIPKERLKH
ncbi:MAG: alpha-L-fucosidase [Fimbriimonadales bacterium]